MCPKKINEVGTYRSDCRCRASVSHCKLRECSFLVMFVSVGAKNSPFEVRKEAQAVVATREKYTGERIFRRRSIPKSRAEKIVVTKNAKNSHDYV